MSINVANPSVIQLYYEFVSDALEQYHSNLKSSGIDKDSPVYLKQFVTAFQGLDQAVDSVRSELDLMFFLSLYASTESTLRSYLYEKLRCDNDNDFENMIRISAQDDYSKYYSIDKVLRLFMSHPSFQSDEEPAHSDLQDVVRYMERLKKVRDWIAHGRYTRLDRFPLPYGNSSPSFNYQVAKSNIFKFIETAGLDQFGYDQNLFEPVN
ncbi:MAG: hypothetical protein ACOCZ8_00710 [Bacteroidota bacterium]